MQNIQMTGWSLFQKDMPIPESFNEVDQEGFCTNCTKLKSIRVTKTTAAMKFFLNDQIQQLC